MVEHVQKVLGPDGSLDHTARARVCRRLPEQWTAPDPGSPIEIADDEQLQTALYFDTMPSRLPIGCLMSGQPAYLNYAFLSGEKGAHLNISGMSGVATKTSYALFLLYSLFHTQPQARAVIFNLKADDLMHLHRPNLHLPAQENQLYERMGLPCHPFQGVHYFRHDQALWTMRQFADQRFFRYLFTEVEGQPALELLIEHLCDRLQADDLQNIQDISQLYDFLRAEADEPDSSWFEKAVTSSRQGLLRRLGQVRAQVAHLVGPNACAFQCHQALTVVDFHPLSDRARGFVLGCILQVLYDEKRQQTYVVLDELNKYAPRVGSSPLKDRLIELAERGRSLGVVLIGAQQSAAAVEERILANCASLVTGRLEASEAARDAYSWLPPSHRERSTLLAPGSMIFRQPQWPMPLPLRFPYPAWATRAEEAG